jgi:hypothetical protein
VCFIFASLTTLPNSPEAGYDKQRGEASRTHHVSCAAHAHTPRRPARRRYLRSTTETGAEGLSMSRCGTQRGGMPLQASGDTYPPLQRVHSPVMHRIMTYSKAATYNTDIQLPRWYELHAARGLRATGPRASRDSTAKPSADTCPRRYRTNR